MIQMQSQLDVADNSGAKRVQCIKVLGGSKRRVAGVGDVIVVSVKEAQPRARVKPGRILFELDGVAGPLAAEAFSRAAMKLPIKTKVIARLGDTSHLGGE